jgi:hypothetical protein
VQDLVHSRLSDEFASMQVEILRQILRLFFSAGQMVPFGDEGFHPNHPLSYKRKTFLWHKQPASHEIESPGKINSKRMTKHRAPSMRFLDCTVAHDLAYLHSLIPHPFNMQNLSSPHVSRHFHSFLGKVLPWLSVMRAGGGVAGG